MLINKKAIGKRIILCFYLSIVGISSGTASAESLFATAVVDSSPGNQPNSYVLGPPDLLVMNFLADQRGPGFVTVTFDQPFGDAPGNDIIVHAMDWVPGENEQFLVQASEDGVNFFLVGYSGAPTGFPSPVVSEIEFDLAMSGLSTATFLRIENLYSTPTYIGPDLDAIEVQSAVRQVVIDIKPGSSPNCFNVNGHGVIPVAILGDSAFDVSSVDPASLIFGGLEVRVRGNKGALCSLEDSNADGFTDLVCHFEDDASNWSAGADSATLEGFLFDGSSIEGTDDICVVP